MTRFPTPAHLASWARFAPGRRQRLPERSWAVRSGRHRLPGFHPPGSGTRSRTAGHPLDFRPGLPLHPDRPDRRATGRGAAMVGLRRRTSRPDALHRSAAGRADHRRPPSDIRILLVLNRFERTKRDPLRLTPYGRTARRDQPGLDPGQRCGSPGSLHRVRGSGAADRGPHPGRRHSPGNTGLRPGRRHHPADRCEVARKATWTAS